jgi:hypothetical protein
MARRVSAMRCLRFSLPKCSPVLNVTLDQKQVTGGVGESKFPFSLINVLPSSSCTLPTKEVHYSDKTYYLCSTNINKLNRLFATAPMQVLQPEHGRVLLSGTSPTYRRDSVLWHRYRSDRIRIEHNSWKTLYHQESKQRIQK